MAVLLSPARWPMRSKLAAYLSVLSQAVINFNER
jgi:hypothetical protein